MQSRLKQENELDQFKPKVSKIRVQRKGEEKDIDSDKLIQGDIVFLKKGKINDDLMVPADLVLLEGRALADESLLTGESVPITKQSVNNVDREQVIDNDLINVKNVILFSGTKLIETTSEKNKNRIKCVVLRTGRFTTQGQLIANIVSFMNKTDSASLDSIYIVMMMLFFGMMAGGYVL